MLRQRPVGDGRDPFVPRKLTRSAARHLITGVGAIEFDYAPEPFMTTTLISRLEFDERRRHAAHADRRPQAGIRWCNASSRSW
ncbi:MAG: hypothetical protein R2748_32880 [Bryobacterales bacterium]